MVRKVSYNQRREQLSQVTFNEAHKVISLIKHKYGDNCYVITQNVDDLLERAGCESVLHVHGELTKMECRYCDYIWDVGYKPFNTNLFSINKDKCPKCKKHKFVKPYVVFFGGMAKEYIQMRKIFDAISNKDTIVIVSGTMGNVVKIQDILHKTPCKKILNNLKQSKYIDDSIFDKVYYEKATTAFLKINNDIDKFWNCAN